MNWSKNQKKFILASTKAHSKLVAKMESYEEVDNVRIFVAIHNLATTLVLLKDEEMDNFLKHFTNSAKETCESMRNSI